MNLIRHGVRVATSHVEIRRHCQRIVVERTTDILGPVTGEAADAQKSRVELVEVEPVFGRPCFGGERRMALHAEVTERALGLALHSAIQRQEHRVHGGERVHAPRPLSVVIRMARGTHLRILEREPG